MTIKKPEITAKRAVTALFVLILLGAAVSVIYFAVQDADHLRSTVIGLLERARDSQWSWPVVCAIYLLSGFVMFPAMILNLGVALVFAPVQGIVYALSGVLISATVFFFIGRAGRERGLKDYLEGPRLKRVDRALHDSGTLGVAILRMFPVAPFSVFNMAAGLSSLKYFDYIAGTFLAFWPGGIGRAILGDSIMDFVLKPTLQSTIYVLLGLGVWIAIIVCVHVFLKKYRVAATA